MEYGKSTKPIDIFTNDILSTIYTPDGAMLVKSKDTLPKGFKKITEAEFNRHLPLELEE